MKQFSSTHAKQYFGEVMKAAGVAPVAIERYGKVEAIVAAPQFFQPAGADVAAERRHVRLQQAMVEKDRLIRHQRIALDLVTAPAKARDAMIGEALKVVERWRRERLCSDDYIDRWSEILRQPVRDMAMTMVSDADGWGPALRQNSPWVGLHA